MVWWQVLCLFIHAGHKKKLFLMMILGRWDGYLKDFFLIKFIEDIIHL